MVKKTYKNPPIVEAVATFHFKSNNPWDLTAPGLVYNHLRKDFPIKRQSKQLNVALVSGSSTIEQKFQPSDRVQFYSEDEKSLIQIGQNLLSVNQLKPYSSWEVYFPLIKQGLEAYSKELEFEEVVAVSLRYINRIAFNENAIELKDYFQIYPVAEAKDLNSYSKFISGIEVDYQDTSDLLKIVFLTVEPIEDEKLSMVLDLEYSSKSPLSNDIEKILKWIEIAHSRINSTFENCIKDKLRNVFEEQS